ncbi:hypothetical protein CDD80_5969 [Ophiocordyceps camponoti-rufipedis]|uniref:F-box domain-containing protein n=1 Tax=Ophiocordyceps camponoti-rufipedis TaxID=2004952 RepID=A0A2C5ZD44_9HYPO|nr:hypothetical protein CDD80_5969 [Ophiocordyceps camponoti-rufipedis]
MYAMWESHLHACRRAHRDAQWEAFKVPPTLMMMPSQDGQSSALEKLPTEVLLLIMARLGSTDQLFLALTSKKLLAVSSLNTIIIPSARKHRVNSISCIAMLTLLRTFPPRGPNGRTSTAWAPCCDCYRESLRDVLSCPLDNLADDIARNLEALPAGVYGWSWGRRCEGGQDG